MPSTQEDDMTTDIGLDTLTDDQIIESSSRDAAIEQARQYGHEVAP